MKNYATRSKRRRIIHDVFAQADSKSKRTRPRGTTSTVLRMTKKGNVGYESNLLTTKATSKEFPSESETNPSQATSYDDADYFDYPFFNSDDEADSGACTTIQVEEADARRIRLKPLIEWLLERDAYLDNMIWLEGRGPCLGMRCCNCNKEAPLFRCRSCFGIPIVCSKCLLKNHATAPLHQIEAWSDGYWQRNSLCTIGLEAHLGHYGQRCPLRVPATSIFTVLDVNGFHHVNLWFCGCQGALSSRDQLLRFRLFPASDKMPKTAFTFDLLDLFCEITALGKLAAYDFYRAIERITDGTGEFRFSKRYDEFLRIVRAYQHLTMAKRGGRAHDPRGIDATSQGELGLDCPCCPHPGKNMPSTRIIPPGDELRYVTILAMDCCFRLNEKDRKVKNDPELSPGWAYTVNHVEYHGEIDKHPQPDEKSTCASTHNAIENASRIGDGLLATGVGGIVCARSGMLRKSSVGDLRQGERYVYMDLLLLLTLLGSNILALTISYDINCQWSRHFIDTRLKRYPENLTESIDALRLLVYVVAKMHLVAHGIKCQGKHSLNFRRLSARTDGEGIERAWAHMGVYAGAQREMGPGFRRDTLNFHWASFNYIKIVGLGDFLLKKLKEALPERDKQRQILDETTSSMEESCISRWTAMIEDWHKDPDDAIDPFHEPETELLATRALEALLESGTLEVREDQCHISGDKPSKMLSEGIAIEEEMRLLTAMVKKSPRDESDEVTESKSIKEKRSALRKKLDSWWATQIFYMPIVATLQAENLPQSRRIYGSTDSTPMDIAIEKSKLYLPSSLTPAQRKSLPVIYRLSEKECILRFSQALAALQTMKKHLMAQTKAYSFKQANIRGQTQNTRARAILNTLGDKTHRAAARYRAARAALSSLAPNGAWEDVLRPLREEDIVTPRGFDLTTTEKERERAESKAAKKAKKRAEQGGGDRLGQRNEVLSWIWMNQRPLTWRDIYSSDEIPPGVETDVWMTTIAVGKKEGGVDEEHDEPDDTLRVAWSRQQARVERWSEEVELLLEEMRRTLAYHDWKAKWWREKVASRVVNSEELNDGLKAHCLRQACSWERRAKNFAEKWAPYLREEGLNVEWLDKYMTYLRA